MKSMMSITSERFRTTFLIVYVLSSLIPTLILIFSVMQYMIPELTSLQITNLTDTATYTLAAMLAVPFLGYFLMSWWISSLEKLTESIKAKTAAVMSDRVVINERNELVTLQHHLDGLYDELQTKIHQLNLYSHQLMESKKRLSKMAVTDELSGLFNRRYFDRRLMQEIQRAETRKSPLALIMIDVDGFRKFNKDYGNASGDNLLRAVGLLIRDYVKKDGIACRHGGDEFGIILPDNNIEDAAQLAQRITDSASRITPGPSIRGETVNVSISCGVVSYTDRFSGLMSEPDRLVAQAVAAGKSSVVCLTPKGPEEAKPPIQGRKPA
jgi:diguanylate cyclase (GGDEF)-like protein